MNEYNLLRDIEDSVDRTNEYLYDIKELLTEIRDLLKPTQTIALPPSLVGVSTEGAAWAVEGGHP